MEIPVPAVPVITVFSVLVMPEFAAVELGKYVRILVVKTIVVWDSSPPALDDIGPPFPEAALVGDGVLLDGPLPLPVPYKVFELLEHGGRHCSQIGLMAGNGALSKV